LSSLRGSLVGVEAKLARAKDALGRLAFVSMDSFGGITPRDEAEY
jgi:hypothetical protein